MIYSADMVEICSSLNNIDIVKYLKDLGWERLETKGKVFNIFCNRKGEQQFQIKVPIEKDLSDYPQLMFEVANKLAQWQDKKVEQVILELLNPMADIVRVRVDNNSVKNGSIFVEDAISLYDNTKKLLSATALDLFKIEVYHYGRPGEQVEKFIQNCRFGQTEIGSYITNVVCPFVDYSEEKLEQLSLFDDESRSANSLTRRVTNKLVKSVNMVKTFIDEGKDLEKLVVTDDSNRISINFLESLKELNIDKDNSKIDIGIKWAPTIRQNRANVQEVSLNHGYYEPIKAVVAKYKKIIDIDKKRYIGKVKLLKGNEDVTKRKSGEIIIVCLDGMKKVEVKAILDNENYSRAIVAHEHGNDISIEGIYGKNNKKLLTDCSLTIL